MVSGIGIAFGAYIVWLYLWGTGRREGLSPALWSVVLWVTLIGSRPVSTWFSLGDGAGSAQAYDEGNPFERTVYFVLIAHAVAVLMRRGIRVRDVVASNGWLAAFFIYWGLSVFWADDSLVALKRWIKDLGNVAMVLVVLTDGKPLEAMKAVFVRSACLLLPVSVLFIRFIPEFGRTYHVWTGEMMYTGVTTHKNSLGVLALVSLLFLAWDFAGRATPGAPRRGLPARCGMLSLVLMGGWLLVKAGSATATGCLGLGLALMAALCWTSLRRNLGIVECFAILAGIVAWGTGLADGALRLVIVDILGRDLTLTTRTDVWPMLLDKASSPWFGSGFNSFWTGERLAEIYQQLGIIQAHNGYLETYLNGGLFGMALLALLLLSAIRAANRQLSEDLDQAKLAFAVVLVTVVYNFTEASFDKTSPLWFAFLLVTTRWRGSRSLPARSPAPDAEPPRPGAEAPSPRPPWLQPHPPAPAPRQPPHKQAGIFPWS